MLWGRDPPDGQAAVGSITSPAQLDFELPLIGLYLDLHLVGNVDLEVHPTAFELEVVVARQVVCKGAQPGGGLLARHDLLLLDLQNVHLFSFGLVVLWPWASLRGAFADSTTSAGRPASGPSGSSATLAT